MHKEKQGKIGVYSKVKVQNSTDLSLAYSPGVAEPCLEIYKDESKLYDYTMKGNLVGVISDGTAVLGLGNIGPKAAMPVTEVVNEKLMDVVTSISGSSPAYVYMFIEAMADAAVLDGMPRKQAYKFAAQAVLGSAKMVLETGIHPGELKDMVCSPGGTTIEAVATLEEKGLRTAIISAMKRCTKKSMEMSRLTSK
nr:pyrroline-5-carboxylate reductase dimerization domain-containing protein [Bacillus cereus]